MLVWPSVQRWLLVLLASGLCCGCGTSGTYPVSGQVVFDDGTPLTTGGVVLTEAASGGTDGVNARGTINEDGTFQLSTFKEGDGAIPGKHRFLVRAKRDSTDYTERGIIPRPVIDPQFEDFDTSGFEFTVEEGKNEFTIEVAKPGKAKDRR